MPQYQGVWSLQQQMQALTSGQWATDPLFDYTTLLLQADNAANSAQNNTFLDSSTNAFAITRNGNTTQGTFSPFSLQPGEWGNFFDSTGTCSLQFANNAAFEIGSGDFCYEAFIYNVSYNATASGIISYGVAGSTGSSVCTFDIDNSGYLTLSYATGGGRTITSSVTLPQNQWVHVAACRTGSTLAIFQNGIRVATASTSATVGTGGIQKVGTQWFDTSTSRAFVGYISNARIVKGSSPYNAGSATITVPNSPLTAISGTSLLTCQSNRFRDASTNAFAVTINGSPSVQAFSPFAPQFQYTASGTGGSGYFDGTGDYLTIPNSANYSLPGDYTIEGWIYPAVTGGLQRIFMMGDYRSTFNGIDIYTNGSSQVIFYSNGASIITGGTLPAFAWSHIALVRSGSGANNTTLYLNGVSIGQATNTTSFSGVSANGVSIGYEYSGTGTSITTACYMSSIRVVKGQALTSGTFTLPTAPVTTSTVGWTGANAASSLTGTVQLLTNFTNAGILDGTMKNNFETVADAKISTSVVKYGSGSMYFDGNGDYLQAPNSRLANLGSGDFTIEFWMYASSQALAPIVHQTSYSSNQGWIVWNYDGATPATSTRKLTFMMNGATFTLTTSSDAYADNTWTHIAVVKSGTGANNIKIYSNGTVAATGTYATAAANTTNPLMVGGIINGTSWNSTNYFNGYLDDLRVTTGIARYLQNFIPPSVALPRQ